MVMVIGVWLVILYSCLHLPHFATMQEGDFLTKRRRLHFWHRYWFTLITSFIILASADIPEGMFRRGATPAHQGEIKHPLAR
jgi:hypothetical protein